jgi:glycosyltransferase involved in cell wall biosynthesis
VAEKPVVSIVMPIYNSQNTIDKMVNSIVRQSFKDWELICVDDGSTDNSRNILLSWQEKDFRIKYFYQDNEGVSAARNHGFSLTTGQYVLFIDSDDECDINLLSAVVERFRNMDSDIVVFGYKSLIGHQISKETVPSRCNDILPDVSVLNLLKSDLVSVVYNKIYKRNLLKNVKFEDTNLGEDFIFNLNVLQRKPTIATISQALYNYQLDSENSLYKKYSADRTTILQVEYKMIQKLDEVYSWPKSSFDAVLQYFRLHNMSGVVMNLYRDDAPETYRQKKAILSREFVFYHISLKTITSNNLLKKSETVKLVLAKLGFVKLLKMLYIVKRRKVRV